MNNIGPPLDRMTHWLTECPAEFYQWPIDSSSENRSIKSSEDQLPIHVAAIASDHLRDLNLPAAEIRKVGMAVASKGLNEQRLVSITVWLLREPWFLQQVEYATQICRLLTDDLAELAELIEPQSVVTDPDRREELVRRCLSRLGFRPADETLPQSQDRLRTLDSVERVRIVAKTRQAEARARAIREAMAKQRAQEAAARYSPE